MKSFSKILAIVAFSLTALISAKADSIVYVGSWNINDGPNWWDNPLAYSGVGAAQMLFGAGDYYISTVDNQVGNINHQAFYNVIGVGNAIFAEDYFRGVEGVTHYQDVYVYDPQIDTVSAYVSDLFGQPYGNDQTINYAFRVVSDVPETGSTVALLGAALVTAGLIRRKRTA